MTAGMRTVPTMRTWTHAIDRVSRARSKKTQTWTFEAAFALTESGRSFSNNVLHGR